MLRSLRCHLLLLRCCNPTRTQQQQQPYVTGITEGDIALLLLLLLLLGQQKQEILGAVSVLHFDNGSAIEYPHSLWSAAAAAAAAAAGFPLGYPCVPFSFPVGLLLSPFFLLLMLMLMLERD